MKVILQLLAFILLFGVIYIIIINGGENVTINFVVSHSQTIENIPNAAKTFSLAFYTLSVLSAGFISALCIFSQFYLTQTEQLFAYKKELEKSSIMTDSSTSQVRVLQSKINVLEKALKEALKNNNA